MDEEKSLRVLVYGSGPVGSYVTYQLQDAGVDVTILARGQRLDYIERYGVMLEPAETGRTTSRKVNVISRLFPEDAYDLVIVAVGKNHYSGVLPFLAANIATPNVLFLGNNVEGPSEAVRLLGEGRVLMGFPVMSAVVEGRVARYKSAERPSLIIGELDGKESERTSWIRGLLTGAGMEVSVSPSIGNWLKYHAAAILPLAHAYGKAGRDVKALSRDGLNLALRAIREGFSVLKELGHGDAPESMRRLERLPVMLAVPFLRRELGKPELEYVFAKGESMDGELEVLDEEFRALIASTSVQTPAYDELRKQ